MIHLKKYPMVVFMHDAGAVSSETKYTLSQGNGATVWASPEWQKNHPSFVLAPQYEVVTVMIIMNMVLNWTERLN